MDVLDGVDIQTYFTRKLHVLSDVHNISSLLSVDFQSDCLQRTTTNTTVCLFLANFEDVLYHYIHFIMYLFLYVQTPHPSRHSWDGNWHNSQHVTSFPPRLYIMNHFLFSFEMTGFITDKSYKIIKYAIKLNIQRIKETL